MRLAHPLFVSTTQEQQKMSGTVGLILTGIFLIGVVVWAVLGRQRREGALTQVARDLGADYVSGGLFGTSKVVAHIQKWTVTLDIYSTSDGEHTSTYTRVRAPLKNPGAFELSLYPEGMFGKMQKAFGARDVEIGVPDFDRLFVIWSNNESKVRSLLADARLRQLIQQQPGIHLSVKGAELHFRTKGTIRDVPRLEALFDLFSVMLSALER
jgi:hypothetical protein